MDTVIRALSVYAIILLIFRIAGRRTLAQITPFDLVLTLIISESIQEALIDSDGSLTGAVLVVVTMVGANIALSVAKERSKLVARILDGLPVVVIEKGAPRQEAMDRERVDKDDVLAAARENFGLSRIDEIDYAVVEDSGAIGIIPRRRTP